MRWMMARLGNVFGCSMKDERTCKMRREVDVHLWWTMICCVRSTKGCLTTDVSQFLTCPCIFLRNTILYDIVSRHLGYRRPHSMRRVYKNLCPAKISAIIVAANMWKNSLKNVESDNNKILYEILLDSLLRNGTYFLNKPRITTHKKDLHCLLTSWAESCEEQDSAVRYGMIWQFAVLRKGAEHCSNHWK